MTTDPGDLVLDPTCGSGTTAYVAEQWGRRWITADVSRVPLALARQRLLTATFPWYELKDDAAGPAGGFVYKRKQNKKGEEVGGIVPHVTLKSIANNEPPQEEVLVDRPETASGITRVTGKFCVEGTIPVPMEWETDSHAAAAARRSRRRRHRSLRHVRRADAGNSAKEPAAPFGRGPHRRPPQYPPPRQEPLPLGRSARRCLGHGQIESHRTGRRGGRKEQEPAAAIAAAGGFRIRTRKTAR